ncbi:hypothetical protein Tco_1534340 [Tanacetum coccineum]
MALRRGLLRGLQQGLRRGLRGAFYGAFYRAFEEKARVFKEKAGVFSELNKGRKHRLHPLGDYIITLYTNGKLCIRVTVMLVSGTKVHTPKGVGFRVADSHTGNHPEDDFTPPETFEGFPSAFGM